LRGVHELLEHKEHISRLNKDYLRVDVDCIKPISVQTRFNLRCCFCYFLVLVSFYHGPPRRQPHHRQGFDAASARHVARWLFSRLRGEHKDLLFETPCRNLKINLMGVGYRC
jgi:hypothetical protein